jgi:uncharacterized membrane protein
VTSAFQTIAAGDGSSIAGARRVVARDAAAWRALWAAHAGPDVAEPDVDFDTRMVAAAFAGERPSAGCEVTITGGRREGTTLVLVVDETQPAPGAVSAQVITSPFHIISLPRYDGEVRFVDAAADQQPSVPEARPAAPGDRVARSHAPPAAPRRRHEPSPSSTGLTPQVAGALAYLAGPFSGALLLTTERTSRFVKFHAWQALLGLGALLAAALIFLLLAFALLIVSATAFWTMLWIAAVTAAASVAIWGVCLVQAYNGRLWKMPLLGPYAERRAGIR